MFHRLGKICTTHWQMVVCAWVLIAVVLRAAAPAWNDVAKDGDLEHLPASVSSSQANELLHEAFPDDLVKSQIVVVFARDDRPIDPVDREYALQVAAKIRELASSQNDPAVSEHKVNLPIVDIWTEKTKVVGRMLKGRDAKAQLVVVRLSNGIMAVDNVRVLEIIKRVIRETASEKPAGLQTELSGSATIGGEMIRAWGVSLQSIHTMTIGIVLLALLLIYRAPLIALVPLVTIAVAVVVSMNLLALLAVHFGPEAYDWSHFRIFTTTKIFVVVLLFGAGTDYCLFLISRYKEELLAGVSIHEACASAIDKVGSALLGSALTTVVGLSTMVLADYGKFSSSGPAIAICLLVLLFACLTLAPALLSGVGSILFWPFGIRKSGNNISEDVADGNAPSGAWQKHWERLSHFVLQKPGLILFVSALLAIPPSIAGLSVPITFDVLREMGTDSPAVRGSALIRKHFAAGEMGPVTLIANYPAGGLHEEDGPPIIAHLVKRIFDIEGVADVRSLYQPGGGTPGTTRLFSFEGLQALAAPGSPFTIGTFVSQQPKFLGKVTRLQIVLESAPFSKEAINTCNRLEQSLQEFQADPESPWSNATFSLAGTTPGVRDLSQVIASDQKRIRISVIIGVVAVLLFVLRKPLVCFYLTFTVLVSYFVTIGITDCIFSIAYGATYEGLNWKVPMFLFVILVAVGQDYNIYLAARVLEEQKRIGPRAGLQRAIVQTGGIITSCGLIMAGTFVTLTAGSLRAMVELGFALSLGILIDTMFVRSVVVPSFFALSLRNKADDEELA